LRFPRCGPSRPATPDLPCLSSADQEQGASGLGYRSQHKPKHFTATAIPGQLSLLALGAAPTSLPPACSAGWGQQAWSGGTEDARRGIRHWAASRRGLNRIYQSSLLRIWRQQVDEWMTVSGAQKLHVSNGETEMANLARAPLALFVLF